MEFFCEVVGFIVIAVGTIVFTFVVSDLIVGWIEKYRERLNNGHRK